MVHADPRVRKRALVVFLTIALAGIAYLYWFNRFLAAVEILSLTDWEAAVEKLWPILLATMAALLCSSIGVAGILTYLVVRVYRTGQYPPPGIRVLWDTPLRTGREAMIATAFILLLAVAAIASGVVMMWVLWRVPEVHLVPLRWEV